MEKYFVHYVKFGIPYYCVIEAVCEQDAAKQFHVTKNKYNECTITKINPA